MLCGRSVVALLPAGAQCFTSTYSLKLGSAIAWPHNPTACVIVVVLQVMLALTFLKSYSDVGKVKVECASGCSCKAKVFDAKNTRPTSELHTERMEVRASRLLCLFCKWHLQQYAVKKVGGYQCWACGPGRPWN